jgi:hypothetical protein
LLKQVEKLEKCKMNLVPPNLNIIYPLQNKIIRNDRIKENIPRAPRVPNPNVVVLEEIVEEQIFQDFDQEIDVNQGQVLESIKMDELSSYFYIFDVQEDPKFSQDIVVQTRTQLNKFRTKEQPKKENVKSNAPKTSKQQPVVSQTKTPLQINFNMVNEFAKLRISLPFMEVVKIHQQREIILNILDDTNSKIEETQINTRQQKNNSLVRERGKVPPFCIFIETHDFTLHNFLVDSECLYQ